jgi:hypothetical protein
MGRPSVREDLTSSQMKEKRMACGNFRSINKVPLFANWKEK